MGVGGLNFKHAGQVGQMLHGIVNNVAEDAVGMLILDTFNATIPRAELEPDYWFDSDSARWQRQVKYHRTVEGGEAWPCGGHARVEGDERTSVCTSGPIHGTRGAHAPCALFNRARASASMAPDTGWLAGLRERRGAAALA